MSLGLSHSFLRSPPLKKHRADQAVKAVLLDQYRTIRDARRRFLMHPYDRVDALHDLRVGVRATRSILREMRRVFDAKKIQSQLQWWRTFSQMTSTVRDLDVTLAALKAIDDEPIVRLSGGSKWFVEALETEVDSHQQHLEAALCSLPMKHFLRRWEQFLRDDSSSKSKLSWAQKDIRTVAGTLILKAHDRLMAAARAITEDTAPDGLHDLRKKAKRLRYLLAGFGRYFPAKKISPLITSLKDFQDYLGQYQDGQVLRQRLISMSHDEDQSMPEEAIHAFKAIVTWLDQKEITRRGQFEDQFMVLLHAAPRRRYRALMDR